MKPTTMSAGVCLAGALALLPCPVAAEFVSFYTTIESVPSGGITVIVYASFSDPSDRVIAVGGTPQTPAKLAFKVDSPGTYYQDPQGLPATAPFLQLLPGASGILFYDTFLTIGTLTDSLFETVDDVSTNPGLELGFGDTLLDDDLDGDGIPDAQNAVWFVTPDSPLGVPDLNGRVPIARLTSPDGGNPRATILLQYQSGGQVRRVYQGACFTIGLPCTPGDTNFNGIVGVGDLIHVLGCWGQDPVDDCWFTDWDFNGVVGVGDLLVVLANWMPTVDQPQVFDADLTGDGVTNIIDLLTLLACWGPIEPGCEAPDFDGDNRVGSTDLLDLLANWTES